MEKENNLKEILSSLRIFSEQVRGFHWNVKGEMFFEFHAQYAELYEFLDSVSDTIAERMKFLGLHASGNPATNISQSFIYSRDDLINVPAINAYIVDSLVSIENKLTECAEYCQTDQGTNFVLLKVLAKVQKNIWKYRSFHGF